MLTEKEQEFILKNATNWYHLADCNSSFFGEPFLKDGYIYYFDGRVATVIPERIGKETEIEDLNKVLALIAKDIDPERLIVWGEVPSKDIELAGYKSKKEELPIWKTEMRFEPKNFVPTKDFRYAMNKAKKLGLEIRFTKPPVYKSDYQKLISDTHGNLLNLKSLQFYLIYPHVPYIRFAEILKDGGLVSVYIVAEILPNYAVIAEVGYSKAIPRISSMGDALLIDYYKDKAKIISYGGSDTKGNFEYKRQYTGEIPYFRYPYLIWYDFYKETQVSRWLDRMAKKT